jgi:hypothetical protein
MKSEKQLSKTECGNPISLQIRITGHLNKRYSNWFDGFSIRLEENGNTLISGAIKDQSALFGLLKKVRNLGLSLISVDCINNKKSLPEFKTDINKPINKEKE